MSMDKLFQCPFSICCLSPLSPVSGNGVLEALQPHPKSSQNPTEFLLRSTQPHGCEVNQAAAVFCHWTSEQADRCKRSLLNSCFCRLCEKGLRYRFYSCHAAIQGHNVMRILVEMVNLGQSKVGAQRLADGAAYIKLCIRMSPAHQQSILLVIMPSHK